MVMNKLKLGIHPLCALQQQADLGEQGRAPIGCSAATAAAYRRAASDVSANEGARTLAHHVPPK